MKFKFSRKKPTPVSILNKGFEKPHKMPVNSGHLFLIDILCALGKDCDFDAKDLAQKLFYDIISLLCQYE